MIAVFVPQGQVCGKQNGSDEVSPRPYALILLSSTVSIISITPLIQTKLYGTLAVRLMRFNYNSILQLTAKSQTFYLKDTTDFIYFIERTLPPEDIFLLSLDVTSLHRDIPQGEGIDTVCRAYGNFDGDNTPIPTHSVK